RSRRRRLAVTLARQLVTEALYLLEHALEFVLVAVQLPRQPNDVGPAGEAEVAPQEVDRVEAHPRQRRRVLCAQRQQPAEARLVPECLERLRGIRLGFLVQRPPLLLGRLCAVSAVCHRLPSFGGSPGTAAFSARPRPRLGASLRGSSLPHRLCAEKVAL